LSIYASPTLSYHRYSKKQTTLIYRVLSVSSQYVFRNLFETSYLMVCDLAIDRGIISTTPSSLPRCSGAGNDEVCGMRAGKTHRRS